MSDLIGLTLWKYIEETKETVKQVSLIVRDILTISDVPWIAWGGGGKDLLAPLVTSATSI